MNTRNSISLYVCICLDETWMLMGIAHFLICLPIYFFTALEECRTGLLNVRVYVDRKCIKCFLLVVIWSYCSGWSCKNHSTMGEVAFK